MTMRRKDALAIPNVPRSALSSRSNQLRQPGLLVLALFEALVLTACAGAIGQGGSNIKVPPPSTVTVTLQPATATLFLGQAQQFQASVAGTSNAGVNWDVNGVPGGNSALGTISSSGLYTAPAILPSSPTLTITAASSADATASAFASIALKDDIVVSVSPASASVPAGSAQVFTAAMTASGTPSPGITWTVNGIAGGDSAIGTLVANGTGSAVYTAPAAPPDPPNVTIAAVSTADPAKSGDAEVSITCANLISPATASVSLGQAQAFEASLCVTPGTAIAWDVNGIAGGNASIGTVAAEPTSATANRAVYTAPADLPSTNPVIVHATAGSTSASATVTLTSGINVAVSPASATVIAAQRATFTATVAGSPDTAVTWSVNGVPNGSPAAGEICVVGSSPCVSPNGAASGSVDYVAPLVAPAVNPVTLTAISKADPSRTGSASVFVAAQPGPISVSISPAYALVVPSSAQPSKLQFFASVSNTSATAVTWTVQSAVSGAGCGGAACGSIDATGLYTAPSHAPSPNSIAVIATSAADPTKSATATVAITSGPTITTLLPSSVMAGAVEGFPLEIKGANFVAGGDAGSSTPNDGGGSGSAVLLNGQPRATTCLSAGACVIALNPSDVQSAATMTVQIRNPGSPGALSNVVPFVIVPFDVSTGTVSLGGSQPAAGNQNIVVVEPTTAAVSSPINVDSVGLITGGNCVMQGSPVAVTRPSSGSETVSLCVHGNGLDPAFTYQFSGPAGSSDIGIAASAVSGIFPNTIELDLTLSNVTFPGVRSLFVSTLNNDRAVATGILEVR